MLARYQSRPKQSRPDPAIEYSTGAYNGDESLAVVGLADGVTDGVTISLICAKFASMITENSENINHNNDKTVLLMKINDSTCSLFITSFYVMFMQQKAGYFLLFG